MSERKLNILFSVASGLASVSFDDVVYTKEDRETKWFMVERKNEKQEKIILQYNTDFIVAVIYIGDWAYP